jgi:hypothetical protein
MSEAIFVGAESKRKSPGTGTLVMCACATLALPLSAQLQGPLPPPPRNAVSSSAPAEPAKTSAFRQVAVSHVSNEPPAMPVQQIIQKFAERESEFKKERDNFTYTQNVLVQSLDIDGNPNGEFQMTSDIIFTHDGKRIEHVTHAPSPTLQGFELDEQDREDLEHVQPFVLTSDDIAKYSVKYVGREQIDELGTYVFDVAPKAIEKNQRYFQGRIWVDDRDLNIVKSDGKAVPDIRKKNSEHLYPHFETFRENIEGHFWFPTYTRSNDILHFSTGDVGIRMTVRYSNYKRFGSTIKIGKPTQVDPEKP